MSTSNKGKGILIEEDDDEPILLPDQADEQLISEYRLSLIGKILNPKKQNVERLIFAMPEQWGMSEKITGCDLGNVCPESRTLPSQFLHVHIGPLGACDS